MLDRNETQASGTTGTRRATLVCTQLQWETLRNHLIQPDRLEYAALGVLGRSETTEGIRYYVNRINLVSKEACVQQHGAIVEPGIETIVAAMDAYSRSGGAACLHAHSHPFCAHAEFSAGDAAYRPGIIRGLSNFLTAINSSRPCRYVCWVTGHNESGFTGEVYGEDGALREVIDCVRIIGPAGWRVIRRFDQPDACDCSFSTDDRARLDRNIRWLGGAGQSAITRTHVAICGLGGLGSEFLKDCRGLGFRKFTLVDADRVEASNLNRLPYGLDSVGRLKVEAARDFVLATIPDAEVSVFEAQAEQFELLNVLAVADVLVSAVDDDSTRLSLQVLAARHLIPMIEMGAGISVVTESRKVGRMGGQIRFYIPGQACLCCQGLDPAQIVSREMRTVREEVGYVHGTNETPTAVVTINAIVAGMAADALVRFITGFSTPVPWMSVDLANHVLLPIHAVPRKHCAICGPGGAQGLGEDDVAAANCPVKSDDIECVSGLPLATACVHAEPSGFTNTKPNAIEDESLMDDR